jgi:hypothetical protein
MSIEIAVILIYNRQITQAENTQNYNYYNNLLNNNGLFLTYRNPMTMYYAFSVRLLVATYTGPIFRIRRSNDNVESDFYADSTQTWLTTGANNTGTTYATWIGANTGYVVTWYDQSGKGNHATQTTTTIQPSISLQNGKYALYFVRTGSGNYLSMTNDRLRANTLFCHFYPTSGSSFNCNTIFTAGIGFDFGQRFTTGTTLGENYGDWYFWSSGLRYGYVNGISAAGVSLNTWNAMASSVQMPGVSSDNSNKSLSVIGTDGYSRDRGLTGYMSELIGHNIQMPTSELISFNTNRLYSTLPFTVNTSNATDITIQQTPKLMYYWYLGSIQNSYLNSVTIRISGATNNGGYMVLNTWISSNQSNPWADQRNYTSQAINDMTVQPRTINFTNALISANDFILFDWTTMAGGRVFNYVAVSNANDTTYFNYMPAPVITAQFTPR